MKNKLDNITNKIIKKNKFINKKLYKILLIIFNSTSIIIFLLFTKFFKFFIKNKIYLKITPIITFSTLHKPLKNIIITFNNIQSKILNNFKTSLINHFLTSPIKI